ncbi:MAG: cysteine protease StiP family protein [Methylovulum sp.]|jgi:hypothetical protein|nr:cysteine protease StiP family protein [Methylovulum sp.]TSA42389.1 MAG: hypothetical protein D4R63_00525 [Methylococcaceae bacterium]
MNNTFFSGSYQQHEVQFLLKPITLPMLSLADKERLIQSGEKHYSQMLTAETVPSAEYLRLFYQAMSENKQRVANDLLILARKIIATRAEDITLVSLARAGTPIGVLLKTILTKLFKKTVRHYSLSIIRDVGIDQNALHFITQQHAINSLVFVDGWTGKGIIANELTASLARYAAHTEQIIPAELYVLTDLSGHAHLSASTEDYLIPSCLLNATVSGLISRSVYDQAWCAEDDFHGCVYYEHFKADDLSRYFIDEIYACCEVLATLSQQRLVLDTDTQQLHQQAQACLQHLAEQFAITNYHYIKPGIGEATRVLLRREARCLVLQASHASDTAHLRFLAEAREVPIVINPELPYQAVAIIKHII